MSGERLVTLGRISGAFGVRGWIRLRSDADPPENILEYSPWQLGAPGCWREQAVLEGRRHGAAVVARIEGCEDRDAALALAGDWIAVARAQLPTAAEGEYYWVDLIGARVRNLGGDDLGEVVRMMATGANDVLVVRGDRERLVPFVPGRYVSEVDVEGRRIVVDWAMDD